MKAVKHIVFFIFSLVLPIVVFAVSSNILLRVPDVYQDEFKSSENIQNIGIPYTNNQMGDFVSDFMFYSTDSLELVDFEKGTKLENFTFSENENDFAINFRRALTIFLIIGGIMAVYIAGVVIWSIKKDQIKVLKKSIKNSIYFYILMMANYISFFFIFRNNPFHLFKRFGYYNAENDLLPQIITEHLILKLYVVVGIGTLLLIFGIIYFLNKLIAPKKVFSRG